MVVASLAAQYDFGVSHVRDFHSPGRSEVYAQGGMCATSHPLAARTAVAMLESGGNAVDAAIAGALVLGLAEPHMAGIGGDCFALIKLPGDDRVVAVNGSGLSPARASSERLRAAGHKRMPLQSAVSVTIPGAVDAFCRMSTTWGRRDLGAVFAPAISYAEEGIPVAPRVAHDWAHHQDTLNRSAWDFYSVDGAAPVAGQVFRAPGQAEVLRRIARHGPGGFYDGDVAADMHTALREAGGCHKIEDFAGGKTVIGEPISGMYRGVELLEHPPNSQGVIAILMAKILEQFDFSTFSPLDPYRAHLELEAAKLAHDARARLLADGGGDLVAALTSDAFAAELAAKIDPTRALELTIDPPKEAVHQDTVYITVVDRDLMAVSLIYSLYHAFGSGIASPKYGILLHNRGAGFSLEPGHPNEFAGQKRPMHTIIPAMLRENDEISTAFGVMGGAYQPTGHVRLLSNWQDFGMGLQEAIDAPRCFSDGPVVRIERGYPRAVAQELIAMGHHIETAELPIGGAQAIRIDRARGVLCGASDPRKDGCALGY